MRAYFKRPSIRNRFKRHSGKQHGEQALEDVAVPKSKGSLAVLYGDGTDINADQKTSVVVFARMLSLEK